jgi:hypothetical protein
MMYMDCKQSARIDNLDRLVQGSHNPADYTETNTPPPKSVSIVGLSRCDPLATCLKVWM